jgi:predicted nucleic acid-binding protein
LKVLFDTNVLLDVLLDRRPFSSVAARLLARVESGELEGLLGATTLTTIHYLLAKEIGNERALKAVRKLLFLFTVAQVDGRVLSLATELPFADFEDAVLHEAARLAGATAIVTRNVGDFGGATLAVEAPDELEAGLLTDTGASGGKA